MKPRSLTPLWRISRSSRRSTACANVACDRANARWCTAPGSVDVRVGSGVRSSFVKIVISRPSPGSKYRWLSLGLSRLGCSNTNGIPSTPSQKSIDVRRSAPTIVMWWTPWLCSLRMPLLPLDQLRFVLAALQGSPRHQLDARLDDQRTTQTLADRVREFHTRPHVARELDGDRQRRILLDARGGGAHEDVAADVGRERAHHLAHGGGEDVDAAHDQHVVGAADAADARAGTAARARARPDPHVVARTEAQQRRRTVLEVGQHELALGAVVHGDRVAGARIDQLGVDEPARAEVHPVLVLALAPQRDADVADAHRLGHLRAPALLELRAERGLAAAGLAGHEDPLHAAVGEVVLLGRVGGVGGREHRALRRKQLHRAEQALGVAGADGDVGQADALERGERGAGREPAPVVGGADALAGLDPRRPVAVGRAGDPVLEVARGERDVARGTRRAAGAVDPHDLGRVGGEVRAERALGRDGVAQLLLGGQRQLGDPVQRHGLDVPVERRAGAQVAELLGEARGVERELLLPRQRVYSIASSACAAIRKPIGFSRSSARWASRPAVRARIGTALIAVAGKPRSSITAAIGIETFMVSGRPQASAAASRNARARSTFLPLTPCRPASSRMRSARGSSGLCTGWPKPGSFPFAARISFAISRGSRGSASTLAHSSAVPRMTGPQPRMPAATAPCSEPGSAASVIRAATLVGIIPCSAMATSSRSRKKRCCSVGSPPVNSRWKYSVNVSRPIRSPVRSRPRTSTGSGYAWAM